MADDDIPFDRSVDARPGEVRQLSPLIRRLIANNGGPFTFTGTCTYIVGKRDVTVIDPGPVEIAHRDTLLEALEGCRVRAILVTHTHRDHSPAALLLKAATGAPIHGPAPIAARRSNSAMDAQALDAAFDQNYAPDEIMVEGDEIACPEFSLKTLPTPGHTSNHLAFALAEESALFSGDHVMAWSTTVVAPPDGSMSAYMTSLGKLQGRPETIYWPGHGGPVRNPQRFVRALVHHRRQREQAILARLRAGDQRIDDIVRSVYRNLAVALRGAAALSVLAHIEDLKERGLVRSKGADTLSALYQAVDPGQFSAA